MTVKDKSNSWHHEETKFGAETKGWTIYRIFKKPEKKGKKKAF
jgi:hypothetical protein